MDSSIDYTPVLLAQLTDLQMRVTNQDATIAALKADVERLTGRSVGVSDASTMRTSVPLRPSAQEYKPRNDFRPRGDFRPHNGPHDGSRPRSPFVPRDTTDGAAPRSRPRVAGANSGDATHKHPTMSLSDVLKKDETVTIHVGIGTHSTPFAHTNAQATFDGTDLTVTSCELVKSLVGMKSSKPGEILYRFMEELKEGGHIKSTFGIAPWRLCFVERNGVRVSLEELRSTVG